MSQPQYRNITWNATNKEFSGTYAMASFSSFTNALNSGDLTLLPIGLQEKLSVLNDQINHYNFLIKESFTVYKILHLGTPMVDIQANKIIHNIQGILTVMQQTAKDVKQSLQSELND